MAFFKKNPNEAAYADGHKHFCEVIKNSGPKDYLIWRQPEEDFNTNSTLIVMPGEAAIFVKGGTIEQVFENGTYKLSTQNYPFISRLRNVLTGGISVFNCVVFFVKTADTTELKWGTDSPLQVRDRLTEVVCKLRARGAYRVRVTDPAKLLTKLLGNNYNACTPDGIKSFVREQFQGKIRSHIMRAITEKPNGSDLFDIGAELDIIAELIQPYMDETLADYGLKCVNFSIAAIDIENNEELKKYTEMRREEFQTRRARAEGQREAMDILGGQWAAQQQFDLMNNMAENMGGGDSGLAGAAAGIGMGMAAGNMFGGMAQNMMGQPMMNGQMMNGQMMYGQPMQGQMMNGQMMQGQPMQGQMMNGQMMYGQPMQGQMMNGQMMQGQPPQAAQPAEDPMAALQKLKALLDAGLIEQAEYDKKKAEILSRM